MQLLTVSLISMLICLFASAEAAAIATVPSSPLPGSSPLIITGYKISGSQSSVDFVQIYNDSDELIKLDGWQLAYTDSLSVARQPVHTLSGYMLPMTHYVLSLEDAVDGEGVEHYAAPKLATGVKLKSILLIPPVDTMQSHEITVASDGIYRRNLISTGYSASTFTKQDPAVFTNLAADPLYQVPEPPKLRVVEILPRSADCAPNDLSLVCGDYVKLQNISGETYDASSYRLRTDSGTSASGNTFALDWFIEPDAYVTVHLKNDGEPLSLTDAGGYVWLEDAMGLVAFYDQTMVQYQSASSSGKQGWAWALDNDGAWKWTSTPQPDVANVITTPEVEVQGVSTSENECPAGKYRNPETGRCKNIEEAIATLVACDEGEYRSPETNRCRKVATAASAVLAPCGPGEERNPATNRCRQMVGEISATALPACPAGQERNPETNRCRKVTSGSAATTLTDPPVTDSSSLWAGGAVLAVAAGYGFYEWRSEIWKFGRRITSIGKS